jgi:hypothetical protein
VRDHVHRGRRGAAGVVGYGPGFLDPDLFAARSVWPVYPVPTLAVPTDQGRRLRDALARGPVRLDITGSATPSTVYSLDYPWTGAIPNRLPSTVDNHNLYRVDERIHADAPGVATLNWNAELPWQVGTPIRGLGSGNSLSVRAPATIATYFGPVAAGLGWNHGASLMYDAPDSVTGYHRNGWSESRFEEFAKAGRRTEDLGEQPMVSNTTKYPASSSRYAVPTCLSCRNGNMFNPVNVLDNDGTGGGYQAYDITNGAYGDPQTQLHLYRDGTEIPVQIGIAWLAPPFIGYFNPYFTLPPGPAGYRLTEQFTTDWAMQRYARTVDTSWTFRSQAPASGYTSTADGANCMGWYIRYPSPPDVCQATGQLFLGYDLGLDLDNTLPAGSARFVTVSAYHSPLLDRAPSVTGLQLWQSADGTTWTPVHTIPLGGGRYGAILVNPRGATAVSLKARATDTAGNTVDQTITHAYGLH